MSGRWVVSLCIYLLDIRGKSACPHPWACLGVPHTSFLTQPQVGSAEVLSVFDWYHYWSLVIDYCLWWNIQGEHTANSNHSIHHGCSSSSETYQSHAIWPHQANCWWLLCVYNLLCIYYVSSINQSHWLQWTGKQGQFLLCNVKFTLQLTSFTSLFVEICDSLALVLLLKKKSQMAPWLY
jgi:hypothetical protein